MKTSEMITTLIIEKQWITKQNHIATIKIDLEGNRVVYITLPKQHKLEDIEYDSIKLNSIEVRNGLTYSGYNNYIGQNTELWSFGFDYAHYNDAPDVQTALKKFTERNTIPAYYEKGLMEQKNPRRTLTSIKQVKKDLESLSKQLEEITI